MVTFIKNDKNFKMFWIPYSKDESQFEKHKITKFGIEDEYRFILPIKIKLKFIIHNVEGLNYVSEFLNFLKISYEIPNENENIYPITIFTETNDLSQVRILYSSKILHNC